MFRSLLLLVIVCFFVEKAMAQETKKEAENTKTKMDVFASKTGTITKFVDFKLPALKTDYTDAETRIRKISDGVISACFFQIVKEGRYGNTTASIEYSDLLEVLKALQVLKENVAADVSANPDYMENKFTTVDGFQIGYYVSKGKATWYIKLEKYGSDNTLYLKNVDVIEAAFNLGKQKTEDVNNR